MLNSRSVASRFLHVARSRPRRPARSAQLMLDELLVGRIKSLIHEHPTFGYRRVWAMLRFRQGVRVNRKTVYRVLEQKRWFVHQRTWTPRPRVHGRRSEAEQSNERWAMDMTHVPCGRDGWAHLAAVIDCHDREIIGYEFALRGRAKEAERAIGRCTLASVRCVPRDRLRCSGATTISSSRTGASGPHAATTGFGRNSSRSTRQSRTGWSNASFAASRRSASGSGTSRTSARRVSPSRAGSTGTTPAARTRRSATGARGNTEQKSHVWLDLGGALHCSPTSLQRQWRRLLSVSAPSHQRIRFSRSFGLSSSSDFRELSSDDPLSHPAPLSRSAVPVRRRPC